MNSFSFALCPTRRRKRTSKGSVIVEGAAMLPIFVGVGMLLVVLVMFVGTYLYYLIQLTFIANNVSNYAANRCLGNPSQEPDVDVINNLQTQVDILANGVGITGVTTQVNDSATSFDTKLTMHNVQFFGNKFDLLGCKIGLPSAISATGAALIDNTKPKFWGYISSGGELTANPDQGVAIVPLFGCYNNVYATYHNQQGVMTPDLPFIYNCHNQGQAAIYGGNHLSITWENGNAAWGPVGTANGYNPYLSSGQ